VIPKDVRPILGKSKFFETTGTGDLRIAQSITMKRVIKWKSEIESARNNYEDPIIKSSKELYRLEKTEKRQTVKSLIRDVIEEEEQRIKESHGEEVSKIFKSVTSGESQVLKDFLPKWKEYQIKRGLSNKNIDQMFVDINLMVEYLPTTDFLESTKTHSWIKYQTKTSHLTPSSVTRIVKSCRNFYKFLQDTEIVPESNTNPFNIPNESKISKNPNSKSINKVKSWIPLENHEVVNLYQESIKKEDITLSDLILIGCYTGMRIEEICSLRKIDVDLNKNFIKVTDAKTDAGNRIVPIHPKLKLRIKELMKIKDDEYFLPNLPLNKYGDRSNSIGKRFGNLKKKLGYSNRQVFHSIRKTVTTQLENSYINENITADILGHEKPRITYGQYSGGTNLKIKLDSIKKINYDFSKIVKSPNELKEEQVKKYMKKTVLKKKNKITIERNFQNLVKSSTPTNSKDKKTTTRKTTTKTV
jgi:integrase